MVPMMQLAVEDVLQLSPDEASAKAAKGLVIPGKWPRLEFDDAAVWGECQGSGSKPYQVQVDKAGPAFRCSCPSHKFPCKHGLALLLLLAQQPASFRPGAQPAWVSEWLASRRQRAEKQEQKRSEASSAAADPEAAAKREAAREARMAGGLDDLGRWLGDRLRQGLAQLPSDPAPWEAMAVRMVDAQLPGLAYRLRRIGKDIGKGEGWPARVLGGMGRLQLLIEAFGRLDTLAPTVRADVLRALGVTTERELVLAGGERVSDDWLVQGQACDEEERLWVRRVWLRGQRSGRWALLQDYAHGGRRFEQAWITGSRVATTLVFFPGSVPLRALVEGEVTLQAAADQPPVALEGALAELAAALSADPWLSPWPLRIDDGVPARDAQGWCLRVGDRRLPLQVSDDDGWQLVAEAGGSPLGVAGEWDGEMLRPLSAWNPALAWTEEVAA